MEKTVNLDVFDRRILFELDCDARQPLSQLARKLRLGRDLVAYRIERLQSTGILRRCSALINPYKLGYSVYKTYLRLEPRRERVAEFIRDATKQSRCFWVAESHGSWDLIVGLRSSSPYEFHELQDRMLSKFDDIILGFSVYALIDVHIYGKTYLLGKPGKTCLLGGAPGSYELEEIEIGLLNLLSEDARATITDLAEKLSSTPDIIKHRIEKLEKLGVIIAYKVDLDLAQLGLTLFKAQIQLRSLDATFVKRFEEFCEKQPHIIEFIRQIGETKLEIEVEAYGFDHYSQIIDEIREQFSDWIRHIDTNLIRKRNFVWTKEAPPLLA